MPALAGLYYWSKPLATDGCDNSPEIRVCVPIGEGVKAKDCDVKIGRRSLRVGVKGEEPVIDDALWKDCDFEESSWELSQDQGQRCIVVTIFKKAKWDSWPHLLKCEEVKLDTTVTHKVFLDIAVDGELLGRIVIGLYGNLVPRTVENFRLLCTGERGVGKSGARLHFKGSPFHRIVPDYICQGGDIECGDGTGGESAFGDRFPDECLELRHNRLGLVSMASAERDRNGSQFFITLRDDIPALDGKHVIFGEVLEGFSEVVRKIEKLGSKTGETSRRVEVHDSGVLEA